MTANYPDELNPFWKFYNPAEKSVFQEPELTARVEALEAKVDVVLGFLASFFLGQDAPVYIPLDCGSSEQEGKHESVVPSVPDRRVSTASEHEAAATGHESSKQLFPSRAVSDRVAPVRLVSDPVVPVDVAPVCAAAVIDGPRCAAAVSNRLIDFSVEELKQLQRREPDVAAVYKWVERGRKPSRWELDSVGLSARRLNSVWQHLDVQDGLLIRRWRNKDLGEFGQVIAPPAMRTELFRRIHTFGRRHVGIHRTVAIMRQRFFWPGMQAEIEQWCRTCQSCQPARPAYYERPMMDRHKQRAWPPPRRARPPVPDQRSAAHSRLPVWNSPCPG